jgi:hypothetical protein
LPAFLDEHDYFLTEIAQKLSANAITLAYADKKRSICQELSAKNFQKFADSSTNRHYFARDAFQHLGLAFSGNH